MADNNNETLPPYIKKSKSPAELRKGSILAFILMFPLSLIVTPFGAVIISTIICLIYLSCKENNTYYLLEDEYWCQKCKKKVSVPKGTGTPSDHYGCERWIYQIIGGKKERIDKKDTGDYIPDGDKYLYDHKWLKSSFFGGISALVEVDSETGLKFLGRYWKRLPKSFFDKYAFLFVGILNPYKT